MYHNDCSIVCNEHSLLKTVVVRRAAEFVGSVKGDVSTSETFCMMMFAVQVLEELLLEQNYERVVYLGDGGGDYCPCSRLGPNDHILARQSYPDGSDCSLLKLLAEQGAPIKDSSSRLRHTPLGTSCQDSGQIPHLLESLAHISGQSSAASSQGDPSQKSSADDVDTDASDSNETVQSSGLLPSSDGAAQAPAEVGQHDTLSSFQQLGRQGSKATNPTHAKSGSVYSVSRTPASVHSWNSAPEAAELIQHLLQQTPGR